MFWMEASAGVQYLGQRFAFERPVLLEQCLSWRAGRYKVQDMSEWGKVWWGTRGGNKENV